MKVLVTGGAGFTQNKLNKLQKEYIYGSLLGDGCIKKTKSCINYFFSIFLSLSQMNYIKFQYNIMQNFVKSGIKIYKDKRKNRQPQCGFITICHPIFTKIRKKIYINRIKTLSSGCLRNLTPLSLAIWYMDDGSITRSTHMMRISTESFTYNEQLMLKNFLKKKWNIDVNIEKSNVKNRFRLRFNAKERDKFFLLVEPYLRRLMKYKIFKPTKKWNKWTPNEISLLLRSYLGRKTNWNKLMKLNHSKQAITRKASYLRIKGANL